MTEFRDNISERLRNLKKAERPLLLTHNGKGVAVVVTPEEYESLAAAREQAEVMRIVREGQEEIRAGGGRPWKDVKREFRARVRRGVLRKGAA